jgi:hypothetical protein
MEELFGVTPIEIKKYDGSNFPPLVNEILRKYKNKAFFGGGSLLHDAFFKDEYWITRIDYDIWCQDSVYQNILSDMEDKQLQKIYHSKFDEKYYQTLNIKELSDFTFEINRKQYIIQFINIGHNFFRMIDKIDFTFNTVLYNGEDLIFFRTTEADVLQKIGDIQIDMITNKCMCEECKDKKVSQKQIIRIQKYKARGFQIKNFCPFCTAAGNYKIINVLHFQTCVLNLSFPPYILKLEDSQFQRILNIGHESTNPNVILCCLNTIARTLRIDDFLLHFYDKQCSTIFNIHSRLFNDILIDFTVNGQYTFFKLFFDLLKKKIRITAIPIQILFRKACAYNNINIARYISSHSLRYEVLIFEDKIYQHNILTVFEYYLKYNEIQAILDEYPSITLIDKEEDEESICSICNENQSYIRLPCGHHFCDCIFNYFVTSFSTKCGICRGGL